MKSIVARIERIRSGHSDRALIHAIDKKGHEYRFEVSNDEVSELRPGEGHLLVMSWSIHESPIQPEMGALMPQATRRAGRKQTAGTAPQPNWRPDYSRVSQQAGCLNGAVERTAGGQNSG